MSCNIATIRNKFNLGTVEAGGPSHARELHVTAFVGGSERGASTQLTATDLVTCRGFNASATPYFCLDAAQTRLLIAALTEGTPLLAPLSLTNVFPREGLAPTHGLIVIAPCWLTSRWKEQITQVSLAWMRESNEVVGIFTLTAQQAKRLAGLLLRRIDPNGDITATGEDLNLKF